MSSLGMESRSITKFGLLRRWVAAQLGGVTHERRVAAIASALVRTTSPLHSLRSSDLRLLRMSALVHDVGRAVSKKNHASIGARMVRREKGLPLKNRHLRSMAYLTLYHRGRVPDRLDEHKYTRPGDDVTTLRLLLAFLRAADALDSRSIESPSLNFQLRGRKLRITCQLAEESAKARRYFSRKKKFRLLEDILDCKIEVAVESGRKLRMVA